MIFFFLIMNHGKNFRKYISLQENICELHSYLADVNSDITFLFGNAPFVFGGRT